MRQNLAHAVAMSVAGLTNSPGRGFEESVHAAFDVMGVPAGQFLERVCAWSGLTGGAAMNQLLDFGPAGLVADMEKQTLPAGMSVARSSASTTIGANKLMQSPAANTPRFDHDPVTGAFRGLLIEEARTNLMLRSTDFGNAAWSLSGASIVVDQEVDPFGVLGMDKLVENTALSTHVVFQDALSRPIGTYVYSFYAKLDGRTQLSVQQTITEGFGARFDLLTGEAVVFLGAGVEAGMIPAGEGRWRCWMKFTTTSVHNLVMAMYLTRAGITSYQGDGVSGLYIWGAQLEAGEFMTSCILTGATTVSRSADNVTMPVDSWFSAEEGALFAEFAYNTKVPDARILSVVDATSANYVRLLANSATINAQLGSGGVNQVNLQLTNTAASGTFYRAAFGYKLNDCAASISGGAVLQDASATMPVAPDTLKLGSHDGTLCLNGHIRSFAWYSTRLSNEALRALTR